MNCPFIISACNSHVNNNGFNDENGFIRRLNKVSPSSVGRAMCVHAVIVIHICGPVARSRSGVDSLSLDREQNALASRRLVCGAVTKRLIELSILIECLHIQSYNVIRENFDYNVNAYMHAGLVIRSNTVLKIDFV